MDSNDVEKRLIEQKQLEEYLEKHEKVVDFVIGRKVIKNWLLVFSVFAACVLLITLFGFNKWIELIAQQKVNEFVGRTIEHEATYLKEVNNITRLGANVTATGNVEYYDKIQQIAENQKNEDIKSAAVAELMRIQLLYTFWGPQPVFARDFQWRDQKGYDIPVEGLLDLYSREPDFDRRIGLIKTLGTKKQLEVPEHLLRIAEKAQHIKEREIALREFDELVHLGNIDHFDYKETSELWKNSDRKRMWEERFKEKQEEK